MVTGTVCAGVQRGVVRFDNAGGADASGTVASVAIE